MHMIKQMIKVLVKGNDYLAILHITFSHHLKIVDIYIHIVNMISQYMQGGREGGGLVGAMTLLVFKVSPSLL
jgi:hypothetical protein